MRYCLHIYTIIYRNTSAPYHHNGPRLYHTHAFSHARSRNFSQTFETKSSSRWEQTDNSVARTSHLDVLATFYPPPRSWLGCVALCIWLCTIAKASWLGRSCTQRLDRCVCVYVWVHAFWDFYICFAHRGGTRFSNDVRANMKFWNGLTLPRLHGFYLSIFAQCLPQTGAHTHTQHLNWPT